MEELTIGVVAQQTGIRPSALRYYESIGLLPSARRVHGHRRYDSSTIALVKIIQLAQQAGFTIAEIQTLLHGFAPETAAADRWRPLTTQKLQEINELIARAQQMKSILETLLHCGCLRLEDCIPKGDVVCINHEE